MNGFLLWATLGLAASVPSLDGSRLASCPACECCGCCEKGTCDCTTCGCECCVDECPTVGVAAGRPSTCGSGCCGK